MKAFYTILFSIIYLFTFSQNLNVRMRFIDNWGEKLEHELKNTSFILIKNNEIITPTKSKFYRYYENLKPGEYTIEYLNKRNQAVRKRVQIETTTIDINLGEPKERSLTKSEEALFNKEKYNFSIAFHTKHKNKPDEILEKIEIKKKNKKFYIKHFIDGKKKNETEIDKKDLYLIHQLKTDLNSINPNDCNTENLDANQLGYEYILKENNQTLKYSDCTDLDILAPLLNKVYKVKTKHY